MENRISCTYGVDAAAHIVVRDRLEAVPSKPAPQSAGAQPGDSRNLFNPHWTRPRGLVGMARITKELPLDAALNIKLAANFAEQTGRPLNKAVHIHWAKANGGGDTRQRQAKILELLRHWFRRRGHELLLVWAFERGLSPELHTHIVLHVPHGLNGAFDRKLPELIGGGEDGYLKIVQAYDAGAVRYLLKDVDTDFYEKVGLPDPTSKAGRMLKAKRTTRPISGKRCGTSQNLGPAARSRWVSPAAETAPQLATLAA